MGMVSFGRESSATWRRSTWVVKFRCRASPTVQSRMPRRRSICTRQCSPISNRTFHTRSKELNKRRFYQSNKTRRQHYQTYDFIHSSKDSMNRECINHRKTTKQELNIIRVTKLSWWRPIINLHAHHMLSNLMKIYNE